MECPCPQCSPAYRSSVKEIKYGETIWKRDETFREMVDRHAAQSQRFWAAELERQLPAMRKQLRDQLISETDGDPDS